MSDYLDEIWGERSECEECGKMFIPLKDTQDCCSLRCANLASGALERVSIGFCCEVCGRKRAYRDLSCTYEHDYVCKNGCDSPDTGEMDGSEEWSKTHEKVLYKDNVAYRPDGSAVIKEAPVCRFVGLRKAEQTQVLKDVPLYEAPYARESIQFYKVKGAPADSARGFELNRELRRVGQGYTLDRGALLLD